MDVGCMSEYSGTCINPYPAGSESDKYLPPVQSQVSLHILSLFAFAVNLHASSNPEIPKMIMDTSKKLENGLFH